MTFPQQQLIAFIRSAIQNDSDVLSCLYSNAIDWDNLFLEARRQSVLGLTYAGILAQKESKKECPMVATIPKNLLLKWYAIVERIKKKNLSINEQSVIIVDSFAKEHFRSSILKGQGNTRYYYGDTLAGPLDLLRTSGDIDVWIEGDFNRINELIQKSSPTKSITKKHIEFYSSFDTEIEVHYRPWIIRNPFKNRIAERFAKEESEACFSNDVSLPHTKGKTCCSTLQFNLVHQMVHIHHHLMTEGVGLRQLIDYYMLLKSVPYCEEDKLQLEPGDREVNINRVRSVVKDLGLNRFASAMMWVMHSVFGLDRKYLLWDPNEKDGKFFIEEVMRVGNFGHDDPERQKVRQKKNPLLWGTYNLFYRNIRYWRFDHTEWFWGPLWRLYHFGWRKWHGWR